MDGPRDLKFFLNDRASKNIGPVSRGFTKVGPGAGWGLENCFFFKYGYYFGMDGPRGLKFFLNNRESKHIGHVSRISPKFGPGAGWGFENCFF